VEHSCYKCQATVEEGVPFCPHCGAPQIRVAAPEPDTASASPLPDQPLSPPAADNPLWGPPRSLSQPTESIHWNQVWQGALLAGVGAALLSSLPFLAFGSILWLFLAGVMTVSMYRRRVPAAVIRPGTGMRIGALAGVFAFIITAIMSTVLFTTEGEQLRKLMQDQMRASMEKASDPRSAEVMQQFINKLGTPEGLATVFLWVLVVIAVVFVLFAAVGGALGASFSSRRQ